MNFKVITSRISGKMIFQVALALIPIAFSVYFIKHNGNELKRSFDLLATSRLGWFLAGIAVSALYLIIHGNMYMASFRTLHSDVSFFNALILSLKRNFISVFLPAGGITSLAFFTSDIEKQGVTKTRIHLASTVYGISGFVSLVLIAIPAIIILFLAHNLTGTVLFAFFALIIIVGALIFALRSFIKGGVIFRLISRYQPKLVFFYEELKEQEYSAKGFLETIFFSFLIELCGIAHLYIAMKALGIDATLQIALLGYVVATLMYAVSPFMRGLGAVEISLTVVLLSYGISQVDAISASLLYRFFEFWLPLLIGALSFVYKRDNLFLRIFPAFLILILGIVNIFSVLTPAVSERLAFLEDFLPADAIYFSNFSVIIAGILLIVLSAYLVRGLRNAWWVSLVIAALSVVGHLTKAIDYEEAFFGLFVVATLIYTRKNYIVHNDKRLFHNSISILLAGFGFILFYGIVGFYLVDEWHYGLNFSFRQSVYYLFNTAFLFNNGDLTPQTEFAHWFTYSLNFCGGGYIIFFLFILLKPSNYRHQEEENERKTAEDLVRQYGVSALDYFKTYRDKHLYLGKNHEWFISFRISGDYAVVLENPVCRDKSLLPGCINEFDDYCAENGLKTLYYRVDEDDLVYYQQLNKKSLFLGQEGVIDLDVFKLEGGDMKPIRNAINKLNKEGYTCKIVTPPLKEGLLQKLKAVSDEWLQAFEKKEAVFSQGTWNARELKKQVVLIVEDPEERVAGFLNIVPDYAKDEGTYDLIRRVKDVPGGVLDVLMVTMIDYFRNEHKKYLNLGMAPLSGIEKGKNLPEKTIKFAYENLKTFGHFKGLRFFKEKYATIWKNKYLVYSNDYDLLAAPIAISKVSKE